VIFDDGYVRSRNIAILFLRYLDNVSFRKEIFSKIPSEVFEDFQLNDDLKTKRNHRAREREGERLPIMI